MSVTWTQRQGRDPLSLLVRVGHAPAPGLHDAAPCLVGPYDLNRDHLYGHIKPRKRRGGEFLTFLRYVRRLYPPSVRIGIVLDNASAHLTMRKDCRVGDWAAVSNVELAPPRPMPAI